MAWLNIDYTEPLGENINEVLASSGLASREKCNAISANGGSLPLYNKLSSITNGNYDVSYLMQIARDNTEECFGYGGFGGSNQIECWMKTLDDLNGQPIPKSGTANYYYTGSSFNGLCTDAGFASFTEWNNWYTSSPLETPLANMDWITLWSGREYSFFNKMKYAFCKHYGTPSSGVTSYETSGSNIRFIYDLTVTGSLQASFVLYKYETGGAFTLTQKETFTERATATSAWYTQADFDPSQAYWRLDLTGSNGFTYKDW